jgi:hypothetical protein
MKCAHGVSLLQEDGIPFGLFLSWGQRVEHEEGIAKMTEDLGIRRHSSGVAITCCRDLGRRLFFACDAHGGAQQAFLELVRPGERAQQPTPQSLKRHMADFEQLWSVLPDEQQYRASPLRGAWDASTFAIHARGADEVQALALLGGSFLAEDLAVTYCLPSVLGPIPSPSLERPGLGLIAPGLCPTRWLDAVARAQAGLLQGRSTRRGLH